ncbi:MAG: 6,7-dimethyl-8-ribityllumazine synthase [Kiritimatiellae bacterium]|jgi:6,7-dimethyl-8-ribityllumazine synthase|nr:6,7-dimethyl-8-ribityllumazine synthase [Kiritimatiellia bacterium]
MNAKEISGMLNAQGLKFGIVVSRFNDLFTGQLLRGALDCLQRHGAREDSVTVVWTPGAFEIPLAVQQLALAGKHDALIALGVVVQGATPHAGLINSQTARALSQISLKENIPVIDGIVAADNLEQAIERAGSKAGNRGWSAALAAIEMAALLKSMKA